MRSDIPPSSSPDGRLDRVQRYILDHIGEPLDRKLLAQVAGYSVPHLQRLFTWRQGATVGHYVRHARLLRAGRKLRMGAVDINEVALAAGYESHAAFTKAFRQYYGLSPQAFRKLDCWTATRILNERYTHEDQA